MSINETDSSVDQYKHIPVLLAEAIEALNLKKDGTYIDATLGGGGYSKSILEHTGEQSTLLSIDLDNDAINNFRASEIYKQNESRVILCHGNFRDIDKYVGEHDLKDLAGIVADIGLSSHQLDGSGRGISFQKRELLDMRFDQTGKSATASFLLNTHSEAEIRKWLEEYGEDPNSARIAKTIVRYREKEKLRFTTDLVECIKQSLPKPIQHKWEDTARRVFQAIRIVVNHELDSLNEFLPKAWDVLAPGGRLVIVSFHSLEDRIVKQFFLSVTKGCVCPPEFPTCVCGKEPLGKILTKKPVTATEAEITRNSRSIPGKLRAIEKY